MFLLLLAFGFLLPSNKSINEIRLQYHASIYSSEQSKEIIKYFDTHASSTPIEKAYEGASRMVHAKHIFLPSDKLASFLKGKELVEQAVKLEPSSIEIRYLRYSIQLESPGFLAYRQNLKEDRKFIIEHYQEIKDLELKQRIKDFLMSEAKLSIEEQKQIR